MKIAALLTGKGSSTLKNKNLLTAHILFNFYSSYLKSIQVYIRYMGARIFKIPLDTKHKKAFNNIIIKKLGEKFSKKDRKIINNKIELLTKYFSLILSIDN